MHVYSKESPIVFNGGYCQADVDRIAALVAKAVAGKGLAFDQSCPILCLSSPSCEVNSRSILQIEN